MSHKNKNPHVIRVSLDSTATDLVLVQRRKFLEYFMMSVESMNNDDKEKEYLYLAELDDASHAAFILNLITQKELHKIFSFLDEENTTERITINVEDEDFIRTFKENAPFDNARSLVKAQLIISQRFISNIVREINESALDPEHDIRFYDEEETWGLYSGVCNVAEVMYQVGLISEKHLNLVSRVLLKESDDLYPVYFPFYKIDKLTENNDLLIPMLYEWEEEPAAFIFGNPDGEETDYAENEDSDEYTPLSYPKTNREEKTEEEIRKREKELMDAFIAKSEALKNKPN